MHTIVAYSESQDPGDVEVNVAAVPDQEVRTTGDEVIVPETFNQIIGALACIGATGTRAKLVAPSLRRVNPYEIFMTELALFSSGRDNYGLHPEAPIPLAVNEALEAQIISDPATAERATLGVFLSPGALAPVGGQSRPVRFSAALPLTGGEWDFTGINFIDDLPVGNYQVVGGAMVVPAGVLWRFVPVGGTHRPGAPCYQAKNDQQDPVFRNGKLGSWFTFNTTQPPSIEVLASAADTSKTYYGVMDVLPQ